MSKTEIKPFRLIGISIKTTNQNGQSSVDCGNLWQKFEQENYLDKVKGKMDNKQVAVYYDYEGDHTMPFSYLIGCRVNSDVMAPEGMQSLLLPGGNYELFTAKGKMPDCMYNSWKEIWSLADQRAFKADFEIYDERSKDWSDAEVDIYVSIK
jgi:predicted transcriptional regulator YdeE